MIIKKIISGGQTGADRAALDVAIKLGIDHGGWVPLGRKAEDGALPSTYQMKETDTPDYPERTEKNVVDSDGTVIFHRGLISGGSALTKKLAVKHGRKYLCIDMESMTGLEASLRTATWIVKNEMVVLNVAGSRESHDPLIYKTVMDVLESAVYLCSLEENLMVKVGIPPSPEFMPKTLIEAVTYLETMLPLKDRVVIANMTAMELDSLVPSLGRYIQNHFGLFAGNRDLVTSCMEDAESPDMVVDAVPTKIIRKLWESLRKTHKLRMVDRL